MRGTRAACLVALCLGWMPIPLEAQDQPPDNTRDYNRNPMPEPPVVWPERPSSLRFGFSGAIGLPHVVNGSLELMWGRTLGLAIGGGHVGIKAGEMNMELGQQEIALRVFPFARTFFIGAAYGVQKIVLDSSFSWLGVTSRSHADAETRYVTPHFGWIKVWNSGFLIGGDVGYQIPLSFTLNQYDPDDPTAEASPEYQEERDEAEKKAKAWGKKPTASLTLFRIGWLF